jgi:putative hydrolase of HD superfamily
MSNVQNMYQLILEINKLKLIFRNTTTLPDRKESTAEHSWSVSMITLILMDELKKEFLHLDELKIIKLALIHDIVEIYAGDVIAFDIEARKNKVKEEADALEKIMLIYPDFGKQLYELWHESEARESLEAKIAKAADSICPIFLRLQFKQSYLPFNVTTEILDKTKSSQFEFSKTFTALYQQLKNDLLEKKLINN